MRRACGLRLERDAEHAGEAAVADTGMRIDRRRALRVRREGAIRRAVAVDLMRSARCQRAFADFEVAARTNFVVFRAVVVAERFAFVLAVAFPRERRRLVLARFEVQRVVFVEAVLRVEPSFAGGTGEVARTPTRALLLLRDEQVVAVRIVRVAGDELFARDARANRCHLGAHTRRERGAESIAHEREHLVVLVAMRVDERDDIAGLRRAFREHALERLHARASPVGALGRGRLRRCRRGSRPAESRPSSKLGLTAGDFDRIGWLDRWSVAT